MKVILEMPNPGLHQRLVKQMTKASGDYGIDLHLEFIGRWLSILKSEVEWDLSTIERKHSVLNKAYVDNIVRLLEDGSLDSLDQD